MPITGSFTASFGTCPCIRQPCTWTSWSQGWAQMLLSRVDWSPWVKLQSYRPSPHHRGTPEQVQTLEHSESTVIRGLLWRPGKSLVDPAIVRWNDYCRRINCSISIIIHSLRIISNPFYYPSHYHHILCCLVISVLFILFLSHAERQSKFKVGRSANESFYQISL